MKKTLLLSGFAMYSIISSSQVSRRRVVEHFTNSNCSICASSNPGIYSTLQSNPDILHITFHPSSPYPACFFSMQNPIDNDARTNYYGVYGGTPRLVVNGTVTTVTNLASTLASLSGTTTSYSIQTKQFALGMDSFNVEVIVKKVSVDTLMNAKIFVGVIEDSVFQSTPNGESIHQDVFRKAISSITGNTISLPIVVNDSIQLNFGYKRISGWNANRLSTLVILQETLSQSVIQASTSDNSSVNPASSNPFDQPTYSFFPNPISENIQFSSIKEIQEISFIDTIGNVIKKIKPQETKISLSSLPKGLYTMLVLSNNKKFVHKIQIQ